MRRPVDILVDPVWLHSRLGAPDIAVLDGSYFQASLNRDADAEFEACRIPGALRFDIDTIRDVESPLPHMLPSQRDLAIALSGMGIASGSTIVVYDSTGTAGAPRVRWTLRELGVRDVRILSGGLPAWLAEGLPVERGPASPAARTAYRLGSRAGRVVSLDQIRVSVAGGGPCIVDARPADRFAGLAPEPRPGLPSGHMPGARNIPSASLITDGRFRSPDDIEEIFRVAGVDLDQPMICSCGSGVTAAILATAVELTGRPAPHLYDGSWVEWASEPDTAIATHA